MKKIFFKYFSYFLTVALLFSQMVNVKAYEEELNLSTSISGNQSVHLVDSNTVTLLDDLAVDGAKVYQQYIKLKYDEYQAIIDKQKSNTDYKMENKDNLTPEIQEQISQNTKDLHKLIPIYDDSNWTELSLKQSTNAGNVYDVPLPDNLAYMVSWTKVTIGDTDYYAYFLYCFEGKPVVTYKCEIKDGIYYGKDGKKTTKEQYEDECEPKVCEIKDNKFYGKDGKEVDEKTYKEQCGNYCKIVNGVFYDNNGNVVDKATFEKACGNPKTGMTNYYMIGGSIIVLASLGYMLLKNKTLFSK